LELLLGFPSGDVLIASIVANTSQKPITVQLNKEVQFVTFYYVFTQTKGCMNTGPVTSVCWVPHTSEHLLVGFANGQICIIDKHREDPSVNPGIVDQSQVVISPK
jgi:hypothetical protein